MLELIGAIRVRFAVRKGWWSGKGCLLSQAVKKGIMLVCSMYFVFIKRATTTIISVSVYIFLVCTHYQTFQLIRIFVFLFLFCSYQFSLAMANAHGIIIVHILKNHRHYRVQSSLNQFKSLLIVNT